MDENKKEKEYYQLNWIFGKYKIETDGKKKPRKKSSSDNAAQSMQIAK